MQAVNTNAEVFVWKKFSDKITMMIPGLYHLQASFFTSFSPSIQVLVNGEPVFHFSGEQADNGSTCALKRLHHSAGTLAGLSVECFLALPARSVVSIAYDIDENAQGFLNVRKL